jgi:hypothetical protein
MKRPKQSTQKRRRGKYSQPIAELRRLARSPFETPPKLIELRRRIATERARTHRGILEKIAEQAKVDLGPILEDARRRNAVKRRYVTATLKPIEKLAAKLAKDEKKHFHRIRSAYIKSFNGALPHAVGGTELKLHAPIAWSSDARRGECNVDTLGSACGNNDLGTHQATAEIVPLGEPGVWLYSHIYNDNGDCTYASGSRIIQDLTYQMGAPAITFAISSVRVDLVANGVWSVTLGDYDWTHSADPLWEHSFVQLDVYISQQINGEWHQWTLLSDKLFSGKGETDEVRQIRSLLSGQTYPVSVALRKPEAGGGDVLCHLQLVCSSQAQGSDGRTRIDFRAPDHGIFVGGIALFGDYV